MFTGIVSQIGKIVALERTGDQIQAQLQLDGDFDNIELGASIACDGVCLTVTNLETASNSAVFSVDISPETTNLTAVKDWQVGDQINLERAMKLGDEFGGHIVSGHVDGLAQILDIQADGDNKVFTFHAPDALARFIAAKGSVTLNGTSLTVNAVDGNNFTVNMIPHTLSVTKWKHAKAGDQINLEIDMLARYVARLAEYDQG